MVFIFTVFAVSLDAYLVSFAYSAKEKLNILQLLYASLFTLLFSIISFVLNDLCIKNLPYINELGAILLVVLGVKNYNGYFEKSSLINRLQSSNPTLLGVAVSVDASIACLSFSPVSTQIILPYSFAMFLGHFLFLLIGAYSANLVKRAKSVSLISGLCLIVLGVIKLL